MLRQEVVQSSQPWMETPTNQRLTHSQHKRRNIVLSSSRRQGRVACSKGATITEPIFVLPACQREDAFAIPPWTALSPTPPETHSSVSSRYKGQRRPLWVTLTVGSAYGIMSKHEPSDISIGCSDVFLRTPSFCDRTLTIALVFLQRIYPSLPLVYPRNIDV